MKISDMELTPTNYTLLVYKRSRTGPRWNHEEKYGPLHLVSQAGTDRPGHTHYVTRCNRILDNFTHLEGAPSEYAGDLCVRCGTPRDFVDAWGAKAKFFEEWNKHNEAERAAREEWIQAIYARQSKLLHDFLEKTGLTGFVEVFPGRAVGEIGGARVQVEFTITS